MTIRALMAIAAIGSIITLGSCEKNRRCNEDNISQAGSNESHNNGMNCMTCHTKGGEGEGCFNVAGSVYNQALNSPMANAVIKLYTQPNGQGTLKYTIYGDAKGNFHTTDAVDYTGLYPAVSGPTGTQYMGSALSTGACNSCHNSSTDKIWTN